MAVIATHHPAVSGTALGFVAASAGGDTIVAGSNIFLLVRNGSGAAVTVTLATPGNEFNGQPIPDTTVTVAPAADVVVPITKAYDNGGHAAITYSAVTSVTVAAIAV